MDETREETEEKVLLFLSNNRIYVWDKEAVMMLRKKYRIVGSLVGAPPSKPRQNLVFSLPLVLLPEEARLLLDKNIARVVKNCTRKPTLEIITKFQDERKVSMRDQISRLGELKQQKLAEFAEIIEGRRDKLNRKRKMSSQASVCKVSRMEIGGNNDVFNAMEVEETSSLKQCNTDTLEQSHDMHPNKSLEAFGRWSDEAEHADSVGQHNSKIHHLLEEHSSWTLVKSREGSSSLSMNTNDANFQDSTLVCVRTKSEISRAQEIVWKFPKTMFEKARCKVFSDLWEKGYFITNGNKFGGDYLVYPGDPLRFHSHFIVKVLPLNEKFTGLDLVSVGRLGSTVKKTNVLASVDSLNKVIYTSVQWSGFG